MSDKPEGPFTVWIDGGYEGWRFEDRNTLHEVLEVETYGSAKVIQKPVNYEVAEKDGGVWLRFRHLANVLSLWTSNCRRWLLL